MSAKIPLKNSLERRENLNFCNNADNIYIASLDLTICCSMKEDIEKLREDFKNFRKGNTSALSVKTSALSLLEVAKGKGDAKVVDEIEDMLMDLEFSIEENRCNCHRGNSCC